MTTSSCVSCVLPSVPVYVSPVVSNAWLAPPLPTTTIMATRLSGTLRAWPSIVKVSIVVSPPTPAVVACVNVKVLPVAVRVRVGVS